MKYNGKEVTEEFTAAIWDKLTQEKGAHTSQYTIGLVLQAAEEVFAETNKDIKKGDTVTHNLQPYWGKGEVKAMSKSGKTADVLFENAGWCSPRVKNLTKIEEEG